MRERLSLIRRLVRVGMRQSVLHARVALDVHLPLGESVTVAVRASIRRRVVVPVLVFVAVAELRLRREDLESRLRWRARVGGQSGRELAVPV